MSKSQRDCGSTDLAVSCHQESTQCPFQRGILAGFNMLLGLNLVQTHAVSAEDRYLCVWSWPISQKCCGELVHVFSWQVLS